MLLLAVPCHNQEEDDRGQSSSCGRFYHAGLLPVSSPPAHPWRCCSPVAAFVLFKTLMLRMLVITDMLLIMLVKTTRVVDATSTRPALLCSGCDR